MKIPRIVIVRGLPGRGKTTFAYEWVFKYPQYIHIELDHFRYNEEGIYTFNPALNASVVDKFHRSVSSLINNGAFVIVCGIFARRQQIFDVLQNRNPHIIFTMHGDYNSIHSVPDSVMDKMADEFENNKSLREFNRWNLVDVILDEDGNYIDDLTGGKLP